MLPFQIGKRRFEQSAGIQYPVIEGLDRSLDNALHIIPEFFFQRLPGTETADVFLPVHPVDAPLDTEDQRSVFHAEGGGENDPDPAVSPVHPVFQDRDTQLGTVCGSESKLKERS